MKLLQELTSITEALDQKSVVYASPKDVENLNPGTKAINNDTVKILNRQGLSTLKGNLKKHGYEHKGSGVYKKSGHSVGIEWDENEGTGTATMWKD